MNVSQVRTLLRKACDLAGSQAAWARDANVSRAYVSDVLGGYRMPGASILAPLGLEATVNRVVTYRVTRGGYTNKGVNQ